MIFLFRQMIRISTFYFSHLADRSDGTILLEGCARGAETPRRLHVTSCAVISALIDHRREKRSTTAATYGVTRTPPPLFCAPLLPPLSYGRVGVRETLVDRNGRLRCAAVEAGEGGLDKLRRTSAV